MDFPEFPDSRRIALDDKPAFDACFAARPPELSAFTFTNIFAWREPNDSSVSRIGEHIIVQQSHAGQTVCLEPMGNGDPAPAIEEAFRRRAIEFTRIHSHLADRLVHSPKFVAELDRDNSDYVYLASDLIDLPGRKFDAKRNFINKFESERSHEYLQMTHQTAQECMDFADYWCEEKSCETVEGMRKEHCAVYQILANFDALRLRGGAIRVDGAIVAFSLGELLNPRTLVVHVEKADPRIGGLYQVINNEFSRHEARSLEYVNREQDLGVSGLRKAKESYHPVRMVEAFTIKQQ